MKKHPWTMTVAGALPAIAALGMGTWSPVASALQATTCSKVQACVNGACDIYIVCDDGTMYQAG